MDCRRHLCKEALDVVLSTHSVTIVHQQTGVQVELVDQVPLLVHAIVVELGELFSRPACLVIFISLALKLHRTIIKLAGLSILLALCIYCKKYITVTPKKINHKRS